MSNVTYTPRVKFNQSVISDSECSNVIEPHNTTANDLSKFLSKNIRNKPLAKLYKM